MKLSRILFLFPLLFLFVPSASYAQSTPTELAKQLLKDDVMVKELAEMDGLSLSQVAKRLSSRRIDLNGDRVVEYIVSGIGCGNANCPTWLYRKSGNKYIQIPVGNELSAASVEARRTITNGYLDLTAKTHAGSGEGTLFVYKFNGSKYVVKECFNMKSGYFDGSGNYREYKTPKVTKMSCN